MTVYISYQADNLNAGMALHKDPGKILQRYLIYTKDVRKDNDIFCLPIYMVQFFNVLK